MPQPPSSLPRRLRSRVWPCLMHRVGNADGHGPRCVSGTARSPSQGSAAPGARRSRVNPLDTGLIVALIVGS
eukprot:2422685-Prymnesium_polylepis.1